MSDNYTRLKKDYSAFYARRAALLLRKREKLKWEDSRQIISRKTSIKNKRTAYAMRAVIASEKKKMKGCLVCINTRHLVSRIPPLQDWKYLDEPNKLFLYQLSLESQERNNYGYKLTPFTFNASQSLTEAFYGQKKAMADFLMNNISKQLKAVLKRPVASYFAIETCGGFEEEKNNIGKLHIHGAMLITGQEKEFAKKAFEKVNRKMLPSEKQRCFKFSLDGREESIEKYGNLYATLNWADYMTKERRYNRIAYSLTTQTSASREMTRFAKEYHANFRLLKKQIKSQVTYCI